jgi:hypothetical protein
MTRRDGRRPMMVNDVFQPHTLRKERRIKESYSRVTPRTTSLQLSPFLFLTPIPIFILTYQQCLNEPPYYQALSTDNLSHPGEKFRTLSKTTSLPSLSESRSLRPRVL